jgi:Xaa-Pro dipeptidase
MTPVKEQSELLTVNGYPRFSPAEFRRRHDALHGWMAERDLGAVVIGGATGPVETSLQYFTNWAPITDSFGLFFADGDPVIVGRVWNHLPDARLIAVVDDVQYGGDTPDEQAATVGNVLAKRGCAKRGIGFIGPIRHTDMTILRRDLPGAMWDDLRGPYEALRMIKSGEELAFTRIAARMGDRAVAAMEAEIRPGMREYELAKVIEDVFLADRGVNLCHYTLSTPMDDPSVCVPHQHLPDRVIQAGDVVVTEISATFWGYAGQILRSFTVDAEPNALYEELHAVAVAAYDSIVSVLRDGVTVGQILDRADAIDAAGFSIWDDLVHGFGGGYLPPILRTRQTRGATHPDDYRYATDAVVVVQPNVITHDAKAGVQVGNALRITPTGADVLQEYPMKFIRCSS